jgi:hypothetical protein
VALALKLTASPPLVVLPLLALQRTNLWKHSHKSIAGSRDKPANTEIWFSGVTIIFYFPRFSFRLQRRNFAFCKTVVLHPPDNPKSHLISRGRFSVPTTAPLTAISRLVLDGTDGQTCSAWRRERLISDGASVLCRVVPPADYEPLAATCRAPPAVSAFNVPPCPRVNVRRRAATLLRPIRR